ncbi:MAG: phosphopyruvate hydratase [Candidatus Komeilibacteria bacterium]|nr:phosphopyruvate hydratase [Candidatus Komeilibacteria bacterium]
MDNKITDVYAREILDSRGNPTVEVTVEAGEISAKAKVPSGASTGTHEALELRDNDPARYGGKGVLKAVENVNQKISKVLIGQPADRLSVLDQRMIDLDGTANKSRLGANAILGASLACARAGAMACNLPLYKFIKDFYRFKFSGFSLPVPLVNVINGGKHADSNLDFQEFWIIPKKFTTIKERIRAMSEIFHALGKVVLERGYDTDLGNEGGYAPDLNNTEEVWQMIMLAIERAGYQAGEQIFLGLDAGSSEFFNVKKQTYAIKLAGQELTTEELSVLYQKWLAKYPILAFEDPFAEDEWPAWKNFTEQILKINKDIIIIGDDLFTTNVALLRRGISEKSANAVLIKPNQIGTLTETVNCIRLAQEHKFKIAVSHRSGETEDDFIADLAVATNADYIKAGAPSRSERVVKYNRLMEIEDEINETMKQ